jgi:hypothetical protein
MTPTPALGILTWAALSAGALIALAVLWHLLPRRGLNTMQLVIRALYRWARWWSSFATAVDRGYLAYRMEQRTCSIEPENEALDQAVPVAEGA